jgi:hypothetical protein
MTLTVYSLNQIVGHVLKMMLQPETAGRNGVTMSRLQ